MSNSLLTVGQWSKQHRTWQAAWCAVLVVVIILLPYILPEYNVSRVNRAMFMAVAILGLNMMIGYAGLLAVGHSAFIGIGAFTTATLVADHGWDFWMTIPMAMLFCFGIGVLFGRPALKIKGLYLALLTFAFSVAFPTIARIDKWGIADRTGGVNGRRIDEELLAPEWVQSLLGIEVEESVIYRYFVMVGLTAIAFLLVRNLIGSRPGRAITAIRDNEVGAAVSGVNIALYKTVTFGLSASLGGLAGAMWAMDRSFVAEQDFGFKLAVDLLVGLVIGGVATLSGPIFGALVVVFVHHYSKSVFINLGFYELSGEGPLSEAVFGVVLILTTFFASGGIASAIRCVRARIITVVPKPPDEFDAALAASLERERVTEPG